MFITAGVIKMSLLNNFPHVCLIRRRVRAKGTLGGSVDTFLNEQTGVRCWQQHVTQKETEEYEKPGMTLTCKIYFTSNPNITERHQILITERNGTAIDADSRVALHAVTRAIPDASAGKGIVWKVFCTETTGHDT